MLCRSANPSPLVSDADAELLQAFHAAPPSVVTAIQVLLTPYKRGDAGEASSSA